MDTDSFMFYIKTKYIHIDTAKYVGTRFDTLSYELGRLLPRGKNKKVIRLMKDELGRKMMVEF